MFECDQLIYIQLQKTGCTHIASLLSRLFDGRQIGKHNAAAEDQIASNKYFISSIRNPWEWYLSLWTFGVQGGGGVKSQLTKDKNLLRSLLVTARNPVKKPFAFFHELSRDVNLWRNVYDRDDNVESFRQWLRIIHNPRNRRLLNKGYGSAAVNDFCGIMTYRYLRMCCRSRKNLSSSKLISNHTDLIQFDKENCYIDYFIRQESLEVDLCEVVGKVRPLTQEERELIYAAGKSNTSKRTLSVSEYYDNESIELVCSRDRLLIEKFDYSPPQIAEQGAAPDGNSTALHCRR